MTTTSAPATITATDTSTDDVLAWEDDPGQPPVTREPIPRPRPTLGVGALPVGIAGAELAAGSPQPGTAEFRYWTAAEAMCRAADFWSRVVPAGTTWNAAVGPVLHAFLDSGDDLNAYYDREGLKFFYHDSGADGMIHSGESPDVVCHELGHAVLDAICPQLWDAASAETGAFHESFADISALLSALQLSSMRTAVLSETGGRLSRSSRLSRLAEQLGWALRQVAPSAVDADCLRNAANRFFYQDPLQLPPRAPATQLSSEVHSFSRVFTGAYLRVIAAIFRITGTSENDLTQAADTAGRLLIAAAGAAPVTTGYFAQVAAHVVAADIALYNGVHSDAIKAAFVRHGILSDQAASSLAPTVVAPHVSALAAFAAAPGARADLAVLELEGAPFGRDTPVRVSLPSESARYAVSGSAPVGGSAAPPAAETAARGFVQDLLRTGRIQVGTRSEHEARYGPHRLPTHLIENSQTGSRLVRVLFD
jgi:hypothetical protein